MLTWLPSVSPTNVRPLALRNNSLPEDILSRTRYIAITPTNSDKQLIKQGVVVSLHSVKGEFQPNATLNRLYRQ